MSSKPSDDQLRQAIDAIFNKYDTDKSGTLQGSEIFSLISDAFKSLGRNRQVKEEEVTQFIKAIDKNGDSKGKVKVNMPSKNRLIVSQLLIK